MGICVKTILWETKLMWLQHSFVFQTISSWRYEYKMIDFSCRLTLYSENLRSTFEKVYFLQFFKTVIVSRIALKHQKTIFYSKITSKIYWEKIIILFGFIENQLEQIFPSFVEILEDYGMHGDQVMQLAIHWEMKPGLQHFFVFQIILSWRYECKIIYFFL